MLVLLSVMLFKSTIVRLLPVACTVPKSLVVWLTVIELPLAVRFDRPETTIFVPDTCVMPPPAETIWKLVLEILPRMVALILVLNDLLILLFDQRDHLLQIVSTRR